MVPASLLARCREVVEDTFDKTALVTKPSGAVSLTGARTSAVTQVYADRPCRLRRVSTAKTREVVTGGVQTLVSVDWEAVFAVGSDIAPTYTITIDGDAYQVLGVDADKSDATELVADLVLIR